jgi:MarC family membrane protein
MSYTLWAGFFVSLLAVVNPLGNLPIFVSYTQEDSTRVRQTLAVFVSLAVLALLLVFLFAGQSILQAVGISLAAFRIAGGIVLLRSGLGMLSGHQGESVEKRVARVEENPIQQAKTRFRDLVVPVVVPIFVGPGSISVVILFARQAQEGTVSSWDLVGVVAAVAVAVLACLLAAGVIHKAIGSNGLDIATRIMGLFLAAFGIQFMLAGLADATVGWIAPSVLDVHGS